MKRYFLIFLLTPILIFALTIPNISTYSIVAYDSLMEEWGIAVQSKFFAVGSVVPYAKAGLGAIATQAWGNTTFKEKSMKLLSMGLDAKGVIEELLKDDSNYQFRQVGLVDKNGFSYAFTGSFCTQYAGHIIKKNYTVQGNILYSEDVLKNMAETFEKSSLPLAERLIESLKSGQKAGGDKRGMQSAALLVVSKNGGYSGYDDKLVDIRVDDSKNPIDELERLYNEYQKSFLASSYIRIAIESFREKKIKKSEEAFKRVVHLINKFPADYQTLNSIAWEMAINDYKLEDALDLILKAIKLKDDDGNIYDTAGEIYYRLGNIKKAIEYEEKALKLMPDNEIFRKKLEEWSKTR